MKMHASSRGSLSSDIFGPANLKSNSQVNPDTKQAGSFYLGGVNGPHLPRRKTDQANPVARPDPMRSSDPFMSMRDSYYSNEVSQGARQQPFPFYNPYIE